MDIIKFKEQTRETIQLNAKIDIAFVIMNALAAIIATYGLLANSPAVVIGAMIVATLYSPILGLALSVVENDKKLLNDALKSIVLGSILVFSVAFLIGLIHQDIPITPEIMARTSPNFIDLMIALAGGAAGAYATISPRLSTSFVGVAIATALVPPLCAASILLSKGEILLAQGALLLTLTNILAIQFISSIVLWVNGFHGFSAWQDTSLLAVIKRNFVSVILLIMISGALVINFQTIVKKQLVESKVRRIITQELSHSDGMNVVKISLEEANKSWLVKIVLRAPVKPQKTVVQQLESRLADSGIQRSIEVRIRYIHIDVIDRNGDISDFGLPDLANF
ncbi:DUF389 domain-containing protein [Pseudoalteromonas ulvae]|uniref:DUF389 domain-containing protein n=1 Tax=Pseudoalteromonas ulvae TaxID=107327 RepID=A0A244CKT7_PSEDV|nr:DUF389 domain-containing protein [Pseudoalteromonas ulvae]OUL55991.1 DUF389 domain-containing protein [Pseudoalteromonas ulvae]